MCARPSFGMTTAQDIRDLFVWRRQNDLGGGLRKFSKMNIFPMRILKCIYEKYFPRSSKGGISKEFFSVGPLKKFFPEEFSVIIFGNERLLKFRQPF